MCYLISSSLNTMCFATPVFSVLQSSQGNFTSVTDHDITRSLKLSEEYHIFRFAPIPSQTSRTIYAVTYKMYL